MAIIHRRRLFWFLCDDNGHSVILQRVVDEASTETRRQRAINSLEKANSFVDKQ